MASVADYGNGDGVACGRRGEDRILSSGTARQENGRHPDLGIAAAGEGGREIVEHLAAIASLRGQLVAQEKKDVTVAIESETRAHVEIGWRRRCERCSEAGLG